MEKKSTLSEELSMVESEDAVVQPRKRMKREDRDREIAAAAVAFFAEVGFDGDTRELARRLGVTQSLIFRYFPSKAALIERVYQEVYVGRWNPYWETIIADRSVPLQDRYVYTRIIRGFP